MDNNENETREFRRAIIGDINGSFWLYDSRTGFDLTHPPTPTSKPISNSVKIRTSSTPITVDPAKSALVVIDMQNFFLSPALGNSSQSRGLKAQEMLLQYAIPAARKAGIRIIWLNWGLLDDEVRDMPSATLKGFGFRTVQASQFDSLLAHKSQERRMPTLMPKGEMLENESSGKSQWKYVGLGNELGHVTLKDGSEVDAGRLLMRDQWNSALTPELQQCYQEGKQSNVPDVWIHKNRLSGLWGGSTPCTTFLDKEGIKTLFFAGVNTDQCVGGSLTDAFSKGYDCILLSDGAATTSPQSCQDAYEYNAGGVYGFRTTCKDLWNGAEEQQE